jgi:23S rRNA (cytosine1962-C5)-methyltransferase
MISIDVPGAHHARVRRLVLAIAAFPHMSTSHPVVVVSRRGGDRIRAGHPWVYRSDVAGVEAAPGDLVQVVDGRNRPIAWAFWSSASEIALRAVDLAPRAEAPDEETFFRTRLQRAAAYRRELAIDATAYRLVHGEADGLPGLVIDVYGDGRATYLVVQTLSQAMDRRVDRIRDLLVDELAPAGILTRNDPKVRRLEGLEQTVAVIAGEVPGTLVIREGSLEFEVDLRHGQKTGTFLDQRENHAAAARYVQGRALDAFTYAGGFALHMATRAESVVALDASAAAVAATEANARRNGLTNVTAREVNVFDELRELEIAGARFDTIVLDPPAFAKNRAAVPRAVAGYKEINLRALRLLAPGGHLISCSCSYNVGETLFLDVLQHAASDARATVAVVEKRLQARDHPVLLAVPETSYLKCVVLRRMT